MRALCAKRRAVKAGAIIGNTHKIATWEKFWRSKRFVRCYWCGKRFSPKKCHTDHIMPLAKGGPHSLDNLVIACAKCNDSKGAKHPVDWNKQLKQPLLIVV